MIGRRVHAERDEPFVVFLIGMRINSLWAIHRWLPVFLLGGRMGRELRQTEGNGFLGGWTWAAWRSIGFVQYWESAEALRRYARDEAGIHLEAWQSYNRDTAGSDAVGIWHETYRVEPDAYETVYNRMPPSGLGAADGVSLVDADGGDASMFGRLGRTDGSDAAVTPGGDVAGSEPDAEAARDEPGGSDAETLPEAAADSNDGA